MQNIVSSVCRDRKPGQPFNKCCITIELGKRSVSATTYKAKDIAETIPDKSWIGKYTIAPSVKEESNPQIDSHLAMTIWKYWHNNRRIQV
jgi:hypothetical protein